MASLTALKASKAVLHPSCLSNECPNCPTTPPMAGMMRMQQTAKKVFMLAEFFQDWVSRWRLDRLSVFYWAPSTLMCTTDSVEIWENLPDHW